MEDFGYSKHQEETAFGAIVKRGFLIAASLFSVACFIYVTVNAYYYVYNDKNNNVELITAEANPIKVIEEEQAEQSQDGMQIDSSIYEDIFGNKKISKPKEVKIRAAVEPAVPPKPPVKEKEIVEPSKNRVNQNTPIIVYSEKKSETDKDLLSSKAKDDALLSKKKEKEEEKPKKKGIRVQVAAVASNEAAEQYSKNIQRQFPSILSGLKIYVEKADLGKRGIFYRLQIGNFYNQLRAEEFCNRYITTAKKSRADCIVVE